MAIHIHNIHIHNNPLGEKRNQHYKLFAWHGTEHGRHEYYGLAWASNTEHAKDIAVAGHFQIDRDSMVAWEWLPEYGTPGWGAASLDQAAAIIEASL